MMNDLHSRATQITTSFKTDIPKYKKIIFACQCLSGVDITNVPETTKSYIHKHLYEMNRIVGRYFPINDWEDYRLISETHLNKMLKSFERLCKILIASE